MVDQCIKEVRDRIIEFCLTGRAVKVEGLGTWSPNISLDGSFDLQYRSDAALIKGMNVRGNFTGKIRNRQNIGKTPDELVADWDVKNSDDPVTQ